MTDESRDIEKVDCTLPGVAVCYDVTKVPSLYKNVTLANLGTEKGALRNFMSATFLFWKMASTIYEDDAKEEFHPKMFIMSNAGTVLMLEVSPMFDSQYESQRGDMVAAIISEFDAALYCLAVEAWHVSIDIEEAERRAEQGLPMPQPSKSPDRKECLTMKYETRSHAGAIFLPIDRDNTLLPLSMEPMRSMFREKQADELADGGALDFGKFMFKRTN